MHAKSEFAFQVRLGQAAGLHGRPASVAPLDPPARLLCGPGPTNVAPAVLAAMRQADARASRPRPPRDPARGGGLLRRVLPGLGRAGTAAAGTGTSGMETGIGEPGRAGRDGDRRRVRLLRRADRRAGAARGRRGDRGRAPAGARSSPTERIARGARAAPERAAGRGRPRRDVDRGRAADRRASRTRMRAERHAADGRLRDVARRGPASTSTRGASTTPTRARRSAWPHRPACRRSPSPTRALERIAARARRRCRSRSTSALLERYWVKRPATYHHTAPILHIYALHEALRLALAEGLEARCGAPRRGRAHLRRGGRGAGLRAGRRPGHRLAPLTAVRLPDGVDGKAVQSRLLPSTGSRSAAGSDRRRRRCGGSA